MVEVRSALLYDCAERVSIAIGGRRKRGREVTHYEWQASTSALFTHVSSLTLFFFSICSLLLLLLLLQPVFFLCMCNGAPTNERRQSVAFKVEGTRTYTTTISSRSNNIIKTARKDKSNQDQKKKSVSLLTSSDQSNSCLFV